MPRKIPPRTHTREPRLRVARSDDAHSVIPFNGPASARLFLEGRGWTEGNLRFLDIAAQLATTPFFVTPEWRRRAVQARRLAEELRQVAADLVRNGPFGGSKAHPDIGEFGPWKHLALELDAFTRSTGALMHPEIEREEKALARAKGAAFGVRLVRELRRFEAREPADGLELLACAVVAGPKVEVIAAVGPDAEDERERQLWSWRKAYAKAIEILARLGNPDPRPPR